MKRKVIFVIGKASSYLFRIIPFSVRRLIISFLLFTESRIGGAETSLIHLFTILDDLNLIINERSMLYGSGIHPKHYLTKYHDYFIKYIPDKARVLDVGCGYGAVSFSIANSVPGVFVYGVDIDENNILKAKIDNNANNIEYITSDAIDIKEPINVNVVVFSNVIEHIEDRIYFIKTLVQKYLPELVMIRVPMYERHWHIPLRKELGMDYFSDSTHYIEHTLDEFKSEVSQSGLLIDEIVTIWGEIWARCKTA